MKRTEASGAVRLSGSGWRLGVWLAWAMSGGYPSYATRMGEVNAGHFHLKFSSKVRFLDSLLEISEGNAIETQLYVCFAQWQYCSL